MEAKRAVLRWLKGIRRTRPRPATRPLAAAAMSLARRGLAEEAYAVALLHELGCHGLAVPAVAALRELALIGAAIGSCKCLAEVARPTPDEEVVLAVRRVVMRPGTTAAEARERVVADVRRAARKAERDGVDPARTETEAATFLRALDVELARRGME